MMENKPDDFLTISGLQHFAFCRRQWGLIFIEQIWQENHRTADGEIFHEKAHNALLKEKRGDTIIIRALEVASASLRLRGVCDIVELHRSKSGVVFHALEGLWSIIPIEYKVGTAKASDEDSLQLCCQAMCIEEMTCSVIAFGYIYYGDSGRRVMVEFSNELREKVVSLSKEMHVFYNRGHIPAVRKSKKCNGCSLKNECFPQFGHTSADVYINSSIKEMGEQNASIA